MSSPWSMLEAIPLGACVVEEDGTVVAWNRVLASWTGISTEEAIGRSVRSVLGAFAGEMFAARLGAVLAGGPPAIFSSRLHGQLFTNESDDEGSPRCHKTTVAALPVSAGEPRYAMISVQDVSAQSERVQAYQRMKDEALREVAARRRSEELLSQKSELLELFGLGVSTRGILERVLECVLETTPRIEARAVWYEKPRDEEPAVVGSIERTSCVELLSLPLTSTKYDRLGVLEVSYPSDSVLDEQEIESLSILARVAEIAIERGHAERSRSALSAIVRSNSDAIIGYAPDGTIESWNLAAKEILGFDQEEALGQPFSMLTSSSSRSEIQDILMWALKGNTYSDLETEWRCKDGSSIPLSLTLSPIRGDEDQVIGAAIIARDITERKRQEEELLSYTQEVEEHRERVERQAQDLVQQSELLALARDEALRASKVKADFLSTMSHEIRTPMNGIIGMTEVLLATELDAEQMESARTIQTSGESLLSIINDILDLSKIEAGKLSFEKVPFDLQRCLQEVVTMTRLTARSKGIELELHWSDAAPSHVNSDPVRIRQVLMNLVSNAIKFTAEGIVSIHVLPEVAEGEVTPLAIEVRDTGIGISEEQAGRIFEAFQQADSSTTRRFGGTGLGLAICKRICEGLGGDIVVESVEGEGSVFRAMLPLLHCEPPTELSPDAARAAEKPLDLEVLLVEDNRINQKVAVAALANLGCHVEVAENGREAIDLLEQRAFDMIFMDCQMPVLNGYDATGEIRERKLAEGTAILAMTANAMLEDRERCLAAGMDGYLAKPFKRSELRALIVDHLADDASDRAA